jgi:uncharacterized repeat protein (TIGR02543 family)
MRKLGFIIILLTLFISACTSTVEFKISFDSNGGSLVEPIITDGVSSITTPKDPVKEGFTFAGWYWDNNTFRELFTINSLLDRGITNDLTVYAKWSVDETYVPIGSVKVTFNTQGGTDVSPTFVLPGRTILIPSTTKEGYTLDGWYTSVNGGVTLDERWSFTNNSVNNDITLYAKWNINAYTITFDTNGGTNLNTVTQNFNTSLNIPNNTTKTGYSFIGWFEDDNLSIPFDLEKMPSRDFTLYAKWTINEYTITFDSNGGTEVISITQDYASEVVEPNEPTREGYTFEGWFTNSALINAYALTTMPAQDITLYANWTIITYTITYELNEGINHSNNLSSFNVESSINLLEPTKIGHTFEGWYIDDVFSEDVITNIKIGTIENITLYAKWSINQYTITHTIFNTDYNPSININLFSDDEITLISLGEVSSAVLTSKGRLFIWGGLDIFGPFNDNNQIDKTIPTDITSYFNLLEEEFIIHVSTENAFAVVLTSIGRVFTWGWGEFGSLGDGTTVEKRLPVEITHNFNLVENEILTKIYTGALHSAALTSKGRVFMWGWNLFGQIGDNTTTNILLPLDITKNFNFSNNENIINIDLGDTYSALITSNGRVFTWGNNSYGQLGDSTTIDKKSPVDITSNFNLFENETLIQIYTGAVHSAALTSNGRIFTWGYNYEGQIGDGTLTSKLEPVDITAFFDLKSGEEIKKIDLGSMHSALFTSNGRLFTWGRNTNGQLGDLTLIDRKTPTEITSIYKSFIEEDLLSIVLGGMHNIFLTSNRQLYVWGSNDFGQLGIGSTVSKIYPTRLIYNRLLMDREITYTYNLVTSDYTPILEGYTFDGWYTDSTLTNRYTFSTMPPNDIILYGKWNIETYDINYELNGGINVVNSNTYTIETSTITLNEPTKEGYTFIGWYENSDFDSEPINEINLGSNGDIILYAQWQINQYTITFDSNGGSEIDSITQDYNTIVIAPEDPTREGYTFLGWDQEIPVTIAANDDTITAQWQINQYTITFDSNGGTQIDFIKQDYNTLVLSPEDPTREGYTFLGWDQEIPETIPSYDLTLTANWEINQYRITYAILEEENINSPISILLLPDETVIKASLGSYHTAVLTSFGRVFTWGSNASGRLGTGIENNEILPTDITQQFQLLEDEKLIDIGLGHDFSVALTSQGRIFTWGYNQYGQLGDGTNQLKTIPTEITDKFNLELNEIIIKMEIGYSFSAVLTSKNRMFLWGRNENGETGNGNTNKVSLPSEITHKIGLTENELISEIYLGRGKTFIKTTNNRIFTWGANTLEINVNNSILDIIEPIEISDYFDLEGDEFISDISSGDSHTIALTNKNRIFTWGSNQFGQLGDGTTGNSKVPIDIKISEYLKPGEIIRYIHAGGVNTMVITSEDEVYFWGLNYYNQVESNYITDFKPQPTNITGMFHDKDITVKEIFSSYSFSYERKSYLSILSSEGEIYIWGKVPLNSDTRGLDFTGEPIINTVNAFNIEAFNFNETIINYSIEKEGFTFDGWYSDSTFENPFNLKNMPSYDIILYGKWQINKYTIIFDTNGGTEIETVSQEYGTEIIIPEDPIREGYTFLGWDQVIPENILANDITITAQWQINQYTITFDSNGGTDIDSITQEYNTIVIAPEDPTREGYTFLGWDQEIPENIPDNDVALTALWEAIKYDLTIQVYSSEYIINYTDNFILTDDGKVYAYGYLNDENWTGFYFDGIIPNGKVSRYIDVTPAFKISSDDQIISIGAGMGSYYALTQSGKIYVWGGNQYGQLGIGAINFLESPVEITQNFNFNNEEKIVDIKLGYTSIAMTDSNRVFMWGRNLYGEIPYGKIENSSLPVDITDYFNLNQNEILLDVNLAEHHAIAYTNQNRIFTWGFNNHGQLGNNTLENSSTPIDISSWISLDYEESIKFVRAGYYNSAFITTKNRIFTWGTQEYFILANGYANTINIKIPQDNTIHFDLQPSDSIVKFQFGFSSLILTEMGSLYTWGYNSTNYHGILGHDNTLKYSMPKNITPLLNLIEDEIIVYANIDRNGFAITNFNNVYNWGVLIGGFYNVSEINYQPVKINELISLTENEKVIKINGNGSKVMLLTNEGRLQGLGNDYDGFFASNNESLKFSSVFIQMFAWSKEEIVFPLEYESEIFQLEFIANFKNDITWVSDFNTRSSFEFFNMPKYDITLIGIKN